MRVKSEIYFNTYEQCTPFTITKKKLSVKTEQVLAILSDPTTSKKTFTSLNAFAMLRNFLSFLSDFFNS